MIQVSGGKRMTNYLSRLVYVTCLFLMIGCSSIQEFINIAKQKPSYTDKQLLKKDEEIINKYKLLVTENGRLLANDKKLQSDVIAIHDEIKNFMEIANTNYFNIELQIARLRRKLDAIDVQSNGDVSLTDTNQNDGFSLNPAYNIE